MFTCDAYMTLFRLISSLRSLVLVQFAMLVGFACVFSFVHFVRDAKCVRMLNSLNVDEGLIWSQVLPVTPLCTRVFFTSPQLRMLLFTTYQMYVVCSCVVVRLSKCHIRLARSTSFVGRKTLHTLFYLFIRGCFHSHTPLTYNRKLLVHCWANIVHRIFYFAHLFY